MSVSRPEVRRFVVPAQSVAPFGATTLGAAPAPRDRHSSPAGSSPACVPLAAAPGPAPVLPTPYLALDPSVAADRYRALAAALPGTAIHYAVKANPHPAILETLAASGASFDVASPAEVTAAISAGADPATLLYSNPIKRRVDLASAYAAGVRLYVVDCLSELMKIADEAPGSSVLCRLLTSGEGSDWPLSRKYGASLEVCVEILDAAASFGLDVAGIAFHVGSQQRDPEAWAAPIEDAARIFWRLRRRGHRPWLLDLGGGFPADHEGGAAPLLEYGQTIRRHLHASFGDDVPETAVEPGRGLVGDAGTLVTTVVAVCWRGGRRWVYLDAGVFTGLVETLDEAIRYRITTSADGGPVGPAVLAGPTCDSADVLYERDPVLLPMDLREGDVLKLHAAGAYTTCYSTVGFNGFAPLRTELAGT
ncbi:MAG: type III PLP-dependent enzyme [Nocardioidaceae bacterium]